MWSLSADCQRAVLVLAYPQPEKRRERLARTVPIRWNGANAVLWSRLISDVLRRGKALNTAGSLLVMHGNPERGDELSNESLQLHQALGQAGRAGAAHALWNLAQGAAHHENIEQAQALSEESLRCTAC